MKLKTADIFQTLKVLKEKYGVTKIALWGSFAKGSSLKSSDIDLLIQLETPLGFKFIDLVYYLEDVLGRKVDLVTFDHLERNKENPRYKHIVSDVRKTLVYV